MLLLKPLDCSRPLVGCLVTAETLCSSTTCADAGFDDDSRPRTTATDVRGSPPGTGRVRNPTRTGDGTVLMDESSSFRPLELATKRLRPDTAVK